MTMLTLTFKSKLNLPSVPQKQMMNGYDENATKHFNHLNDLKTGD